MTVVDDISPDVQIVPFTPETLEPIEALAEQGILTAVAMVLPEDLSYDNYEYLGTCLGAFERAIRWWVGDWLVYGENLHEDRYAQAAHYTGLSEQTLLNRANISRSIPPSRRRVKLSLSVHAVVASFTAKEQKRWLDYAEAHHSTVAELRAAIKAVGSSGAQEAIDPPRPTDEIDLTRVAEVARSLLANAKDAGENVICRREDIVQLRAALGEE